MKKNDWTFVLCVCAGKADSIATEDNLGQAGLESGQRKRGFDVLAYVVCE